MPLAHIGTFFILFASIFVATFYMFDQQYHLMFAYLTAGISWVVVATYEYRERVFDRAIAALVQKYKDNTEEIE